MVTRNSPPLVLSRNKTYKACHKIHTLPSWANMFNPMNDLLGWRVRPIKDSDLKDLKCQTINY